MPKYKYYCEECKTEVFLNLKIREFLDRTLLKRCEICNSDMKNIPVKIRSEVEKSTEQMLQDIQDEVLDTVEKVYRGDADAIRDIYGEE